MKCLSSHLFGDSEEACLKTTCSEVDSPGAPSFNEAEEGRRKERREEKKREEKRREEKRREDE